MPILLTLTLCIVAFTVLSLGVAAWFTRRSLGNERPNSFDDVALLERAHKESEAN